MSALQELQNQQLEAAKQLQKAQAENANAMSQKQQLDNQLLELSGKIGNLQTDNSVRIHYQF